VGHARAGSSPAFGTIIHNLKAKDHREFGLAAGSLFSVWALPPEVAPQTKKKLQKFTQCVYYTKLIHMRRREMRTNVVIDDRLMESALKASGLKSKRAAIEEGLRLLVQMKGQERIKDFRGKLVWTGDLDEMRSER
jgi:Arc/MetJ family transcription regulator